MTRPEVENSMRQSVKIFRHLLCAALLLLFSQQPGTPLQGGKQNEGPEIQAYISSSWSLLTRSMTRCDSLIDPKMNAPSILYLPTDFQAPTSIERLQQECKVEVRRLPKVIVHPGEMDPEKIQPPGLLFLEKPYVVPGGRFNEMYGWDSYFIMLGLIRAGQMDRARGMVENFFFELEHYGAVLNANRTYYLTRSQPPFLTSMILALYEADKATGHEDINWLATAYKFAEKDYQMWIRPPHLAGNTGLSRYYDFGEGPVPEGRKDESGYYRKVAAYFLDHPSHAHVLVEALLQTWSGLQHVSPHDVNPLVHEICADPRKGRSTVAAVAAAADAPIILRIPRRETLLADARASCSNRSLMPSSAPPRAPCATTAGAKGQALSAR